MQVRLFLISFWFLHVELAYNYQNFLVGFVQHNILKQFLLSCGKRRSDCLNFGNVCYPYVSRMLQISIAN